MNEAFVGVPVAKTVNVTNPDLVPPTLMVVRKIQNRESGKLLRVLFDSGGSHCVMNMSVLPVGTTTHPVNNGDQNCQTIAANFRSTETVNLRDCMLPEFVCFLV
jgi:hypothetical protein